MFICQLYGSWQVNIWGIFNTPQLSGLTVPYIYIYNLTDILGVLVKPGVAHSCRVREEKLLIFIEWIRVSSLQTGLWGTRVSLLKPVTVCVGVMCNGWRSCLARWRWAWLSGAGGVEEQRKQPGWMRRGDAELGWYFIVWITNRAATWLSAWWRGGGTAGPAAKSTAASN